MYPFWEQLKKKGFKYGPHISIFLLTIHFIFLCVTISSTDEGLIWIYAKISYGSGDSGYHWTYISQGWQSEYGWESEQCIVSGLALGVLSFICLLIAASTIGILSYKLVNKRKQKHLLLDKNEFNGIKLSDSDGNDETGILCNKIYQRHIVIVNCTIMIALLLIASGAYYANCTYALWNIVGDPIYAFYQWGADYALILVWVSCAILIIICVMSFLFPWVEEVEILMPKIMKWYHQSIEVTSTNPTLR